MSGRNARCEKGDFVVLGLRVRPVIALGACRRLLIPPWLTVLGISWRSLVTCRACRRNACWKLNTRY